MKRISHLGNSFRNTLAARKDGGGVSGELGSSEEHHHHDDTDGTMTTVNMSETATETSSSSPYKASPAPAVPTLTGKAWKRRGGVAGKLSAKAPTAWELRQLQLVGTKLVYFSTIDTEEEEIDFGVAASPMSEISGMGGMGGWLDKAKSTAGSVTNNIGNMMNANNNNNNNNNDNNANSSNNTTEPRGSLDLCDAETRVYASYGHSGAPSPFCLSFQVGIAKETKWKLAFDTLSEQMEWLAAISTVIAQASVDDYNGLLLRAASVQTVNEQIHGGALFVHQPSVREPPPMPVMENNASFHGGMDTTSMVSNNGGGGGHRLWMMESYSVQYTDPYAPLTTMTKEQQARETELEAAVTESNKSLMMLYQQSQAQVSQLQAQIRKIKAEQEATLASLRNDLNEQKETAEAASSAQETATIKALRDVIAKLQSGHAEKIALLEKNHQSILQQKDDDFQSQLALAKQSLLEESVASQTLATGPADERKAELELRIQELESHIQQLIATSEQSTVDHQHQLQDQRKKLEDDYQAKLADMQQGQPEQSATAEHEKETDAKLETLQAELASLREQNEQLVESLQNEHEKALKSQQEDFDLQRQTLQATVAASIETTESELARQTTSLRAEIVSLQSVNDKRAEKLEAAQKEETRLRELVDTLSATAASEPVPDVANTVDADPVVDGASEDAEDEDDFEDCITEE